MKKPDLSGATEVAAVVTVATAQREVQPAVTDSQVRVVSHHVLLVNIFVFRMSRIFCINISFERLLLNCYLLGSLSLIGIYLFFIAIGGQIAFLKAIPGHFESVSTLYCMYKVPPSNCSS